MLNNAAGPGLVLCVGLSLNEIAGIARLLQDRAVVLGAVDVAAARTLLEPAAGNGATTPTTATAATNLHTPRAESRPVEPAPLTVGALRIDIRAREVALKGRLLHLSAREFDLLTLLASDLGRVWSFAALSRHVWGSDYAGDRERLTSTIKRLRKRLGSMAGCEVRSVHGVGYRLSILSGAR
ncbi:winged helix-turn-helix domain-containing protein [Intrasporangium sp.]|jgi:DNA-binding response OmpR family regulator|uniref:winged helix-turn-helix domain-containing protein n=1 Tax=Intrasporangium sp. TaxID=1925024 RepID=UPI0033654F74